jgi:MarR family transcriptional regulator, organic hydroperoxide resistance regulator
MKQLKDYIGYSLIQVLKAHRHIAEVEFTKYGVHPGQEMILFHLWDEDGLSQSQIAEGVCVEPPTITKMVQRMEASGLVERRQDTQDARVSRVYLTDKGRAIEESLRRVWADLEAQTVTGLTDTEIMLLRRLLIQIHENLSE